MCLKQKVGVLAATAPLIICTTAWVSSEANVVEGSVVKCRHVFIQLADSAVPGLLQRQKMQHGNEEASSHEMKNRNGQLHQRLSGRPAQH